MNCFICGECLLTGEPAPMRLPSGGVILACDTCAERTCPGEAVEVETVALARAAERNGDE